VIMRRMVPAVIVAICTPGLMMAQAPAKQGSAQPAWITSIPETPGRVYAMGLAPFAPGEAQAIQLAQANARVEVLSRLRATVKGDTSIQSHMSYTQQAGGTLTGSSTKNVSQDTQIRTQATDLPGLVVEETWVDTEGRTAYALSYLDILVAERELRARFEASRKDLAAEVPTPTNPRERLRKLPWLKRIQTELEIQDDLAGLIAAGGGDPALRSSIRDLKLEVDRRMDALRGSITFGVSADQAFGVGADIQALVRNAVLKEGLGWSDANGEFTLRIRYAGNRQNWDLSRKQWWEYQLSPDFTIARGVIDLSLQDPAGNEYESTTIAAKGVGIDEFTAQRALMKDYANKLEGAISLWLESLTH
jgi:hypothetical protein